MSAAESDTVVMRLWTSMSFENQVVLITGASSGIGRSLALDFAKSGAVVIGCGRSQERLDETLNEIRPLNRSATMIPCDVGNREQAESMVAKVLADFGRVDILINNAGIGMRKPFAETPIETVEEIMRTNYLGMIYCTHALLPAMISRRSGHIVNISSIAGIAGFLNIAAYCASKFAMNGFSESLYYELKPHGIHVSVICPGPVRTEFNRRFTGEPPQSPPWLIVEPEFISRAVLKAIEAKRFQLVPPWYLALLCWIKQLLPGPFRALAHRAYGARGTNRTRK
jgi:short-subunit dehydrogenase